MDLTYSLAADLKLSDPRQLPSEERALMTCISFASLAYTMGFLKAGRDPAPLLGNRWTHKLQFNDKTSKKLRIAEGAKLRPIEKSNPQLVGYCGSQFESKSCRLSATGTWDLVVDRCKTLVNGPARIAVDTRQPVHTSPQQQPQPVVSCVLRAELRRRALPQSFIDRPLSNLFCGCGRHRDHHPAPCLGYLDCPSKPPSGTRLVSRGHKECVYGVICCMSRAGAGQGGWPYTVRVCGHQKQALARTHFQHVHTKPSASEAVCGLLHAACWVRSVNGRAHRPAGTPNESQTLFSTAGCSLGRAASAQKHLQPQKGKKPSFKGPIAVMTAGGRHTPARQVQGPPSPLAWLLGAQSWAPR
ncbi:hypothetical protein EDB80DRAFT_676225 [Ilyonectria destructans]|nr:hypothetical protein EDB80DRAFT_676225 [Ilyonectria destructans]